MSLRHKLADWLMRKELDASDLELSVNTSKIPDRIASKLRTATKLLKINRDAAASVATAQAIAANFDAGRLNIADQIEALYFDTWGNMDTSTRKKWERMLGLPTQPGLGG